MVGWKYIFVFRDKKNAEFSSWKAVRIVKHVYLNVPLILFNRRWFTKQHLDHLSMSIYGRETNGNITYFHPLFGMIKQQKSKIRLHLLNHEYSKMNIPYILMKFVCFIIVQNNIYISINV